MNWKLIILGGLAFYVTTFVVSMGTGQVIHEGVLKAPYQEHAEFWLPALAQDPPDMAALMPHWILTGLISSLVVAALFCWVRPAFGGPGWKQGLFFGLFLAIFAATMYLGFSGVFNLPATILIWWAIDGFIIYMAGGAVLGAVAEKVAPEG